MDNSIFITDKVAFMTYLFLSYQRYLRKATITEHCLPMTRTETANNPVFITFYIWIKSKNEIYMIVRISAYLNIYDLLCLCCSIRQLADTNVLALRHEPRQIKNKSTSFKNIAVNNRDKRDPEVAKKQITVPSFSNYPFKNPS